MAEQVVITGGWRKWLEEVGEQAVFSPDLCATFFQAGSSGPNLCGNVTK